MATLAGSSVLASFISERSVRSPGGLHSSKNGGCLRSSFTGRSVAVNKQEARGVPKLRRFCVQARSLEELKLGSPPPDFELEEPATGKLWTLSDFNDYPALLVMFTSYRCPFVVFIRSAILELLEEYMKKGLGVVAISPNSVITFPQDGPAEMQEEVTRYGYKFPYLYDQTQDVTMAYAPLGTPDFFIFNKDEEKQFKLVYHGQFDDARPHTSRFPITGKDLRAALECVMTGKPVDENQKPSMGCAIKWHPHLEKKIWPGPRLDKVDKSRPWLT